MADLGSTFDPNEVPEDERSFEPMPAGDYPCQIIESEVMKTKTGGEMLKLTLEVIDGQFANRRVWDNLNIRNANAQAQQIAHRALADICAAVGSGPITDSDELHFKPFIAAIKIEPARTVGDQTYDARNGVKRYKPRGGGAVQPAAAAKRPTAQTNGAAQAGRGATGSRPWNSRPDAAARTHASEDPPF